MKCIRLRCFLSLMVIYITVTASDRSSERTIDSLTKALTFAKHDTIKARIRYEIGKTLRITRPAHWDSLLADVRTIGYTPLEYEIIYLLSNLHLNTIGNSEKAKEYLEQAAVLAESKEDKSKQILTLLKLTWYYIYISDTKHAIDVCYKGMKMAGETGDKTSMANFYAQLASIYRSLGEPQKALIMQFNCLKLFRDLDRHYEIAGSLLDIGSIYGDLGQDKKRAAYYLASGAYADEFKETIPGIEINVSIATAYRLRKQYAKGEEYLRKALKDARLINCKNCEASTLCAWAMNDIHQNYLPAAEKKLLRAIAIAETLNFKAQLRDLYGTLTTVYEKEGKNMEALKMHKLYIGIRDSITNETILKRAIEKEFSYNLEKKENENKLLIQQNEIQSLRLKQNSYLITGLISVVAFVLIIMVLMSRQNKLKADQQSMRLEQKLLRSQMNPHFIFNSLQAIQGFILKQDTREAVKYLSAFSSMTRSVLESSRTDHIPLQKEIELLDHYLKLQKLRFGNRFEYSIRLNDPEGDTGHVNIPPMLAQPFIENAVEHGMQGIEHGGMINIVYSIHERLLQIEITDNGYGMQHTGTKEAKHRSMAMNITRERIALMNKKQNRMARLEIGDAFPSAPECKGVKVRITIPVQQEIVNHS